MTFPSQMKLEHAIASFGFQLFVRECRGRMKISARKFSKFYNFLTHTLEPPASNVKSETIFQPLHIRKEEATTQHIIVMWVRNHKT